MTLNYQTIAVLDPDPDLLFLYEISLHEFGYDFKGFSNPHSLLEFLHDTPNSIRLLVIEYKIPQMTGCELADKVNSIDSQVKMVFVTGYQDIINNNLNLEIVRKPITLTRMLKLVKKYME
jgi:DNA-binding NtrC family response regulator